MTTAYQPTCALTGASGYVGSRIANKLNEAGWRVVSLGRSASSAIPWSLESSNDITAALRSNGVNALVHVAWDLKLVRPASLRSVNVSGSLRLLESATTAGVNRLVFISTISAFEEAKSIYGQTKLEVEKAFLSRGGVVIRPGLVYGPDSGGMYGKLVQQVMKGGTVPVIGDGSYLQYLVHEEDMASAVLRAVETDRPPSTPVTVANSQPWPLKKLLQQIAQSSGRSVRFLHVPVTPLYWAIRGGEALNLRLPFRSDSLISLLHQNPQPDLNAPELLNLTPRAF
jgi:nucleoside-diphosphate-sugar epimerase